MPTHHVDLTDELETFVSAGIENGRYSDASEALLKGLQLLERQEATDREEVEWLRTEAQLGIDAIERGEYVDLHSPEEIRAHFRSLMDTIEVSSS